MDVKDQCSGQGFGRNHFSYQNIGFSLIELLIVLAITSILALNVAPNLSAVIAQERTAVLTNTLASTLAYARSQAITKQSTVITCQSNNGTQCNRSENWHNGWIIFIDKNKNRQRETEETLLHVHTATNSGIQLKFHGSGRGTHYYMKYKPNGRASPNGSFLICHPDVGIGKALIMTHAGRLRLSKIQTNGSAITCN